MKISILKFHSMLSRHINNDEDYVQKRALSQCDRGIKRFKYTWGQVSSKKKTRGLVDIRRCICMTLGDAGFTQKQTAFKINRDEATVSYHLKKSSHLMEYNPKFKETYSKFKNI